MITKNSKIYNAKEIIISEPYDRKTNIIVKGVITGISQSIDDVCTKGMIHSKRFVFYLDYDLFCTYGNCYSVPNTERFFDTKPAFKAQFDLLKNSAWVDQNRNREILLRGDYLPDDKTFFVSEFYKDSDLTSLYS